MLLPALESSDSLLSSKSFVTRLDESAVTGSVLIMFQNVCSEVEVNLVGGRVCLGNFILWLQKSKGVSREGHFPLFSVFRSIFLKEF